MPSFIKRLLAIPEQVKAQLQQLADQFGADELMTVTITYDFEARLRSYELLAEVFSLDASR